MKRQFTKVCIAVIAVVAFVACGNSEEKKVKTATMNYLTAMKEADYQKAKEYATPETSEILDFISQLAGQDTAAIARAKEVSKDIKIVITEVKINNDNAEVTYTQENKVKDANAAAGQDEKRTETLTLKKVDGKWLIHQPKEDNNGHNDDGFIEEEEIVEIDDVPASE